MSHCRAVFPVYFVLAIGGLLAGACSIRALRHGEEDRHTAQFFADLLLHRKLLAGPASVDTGNRYRATVQVYSSGIALRDKESSGQCSGSLIAPRLALTAAHCLCLKRRLKPEEQAQVREAARNLPRGDVLIRAAALRGRVIESATAAEDCVQDVTVSTVIYDPPKGKAGAGLHIRKHPGRVRPHPNFEQLYDRQNIVWSNADVAVIFLTEPLAEPEQFPIYRLADAEIKMGEPVTIVGFGWTESNESYWERRFGDNEVSWIRQLESGVEFVAGAQRLKGGKEATHVYGGDSGGGCFRAGDNRVLVGVIGARAESATGESFSVITGVYPHRKWLTAQIEEARGQVASP